MTDNPDSLGLLTFHIFTPPHCSHQCWPTIANSIGVTIAIKIGEENYVSSDLQVWRASAMLTDPDQDEGQATGTAISSLDGPRNRRKLEGVAKI